MLLSGRPGQLLHLSKGAVVSPPPPSPVALSMNHTLFGRIISHSWSPPEPFHSNPRSFPNKTKQNKYSNREDLEQKKTREEEEEEEEGHGACHGDKKSPSLICWCYK